MQLTYSYMPIVPLIYYCYWPVVNAYNFFVVGAHYWFSIWQRECLLYHWSATHCYCLLLLCWPECTTNEEMKVVTKGHIRLVVANEDHLSSEVACCSNVLFGSKVVTCPVLMQHKCFWLDISNPDLSYGTKN